MSMSQEEIEALMNGLDEPAPAEEVSVEEEEAQEESTEMSADDIENLIAETQTATEEEPVQAEAPEEAPIEEPEETEPETKTQGEENDIDDLLAQLDVPAEEEAVVEESASEEEEAQLEDIPMPELDEVSSEQEDSASESEDVDTSDIDALLAGIDGISDDDTPSSDYDLPESKDDDETNEALARAWTNDQVDKGVFPSPVEPDTKVVGQLSQVAKDSEDKAGQIFDVLSLILDENNEIQKNSKSSDEFLESQVKLLATLTQKFPNIAVFKEHLDIATSLQGSGKDSCDRIDNMNMKIFEAMEQMQFFDINRQKIERVMSVIKKLSNYLNNLFEDTEGYNDVQIAKHIHGDSTESVVDDQDLEALIAEFNK